jgi:hypothetical protein
LLNLLFRYIDGCTLTDYLKKDQSKDRSWLMEMLWNARLKLPHDIEFVDFKNADNIMLKLDRSGVAIGVMFLEGGVEIAGTKNAL